MTKVQGRIKVLKNERVADIFPLLSAVKNDEAKMLIPANKNEKA